MQICAKRHCVAENGAKNRRCCIKTASPMQISVSLTIDLCRGRGIPESTELSRVRLLKWSVVRTLVL